MYSAEITITIIHEGSRETHTSQQEYDDSKSRTFACALANCMMHQVRPYQLFAAALDLYAEVTCDGHEDEADRTMGVTDPIDKMLRAAQDVCEAYDTFDKKLWVSVEPIIEK